MKRVLRNVGTSKIGTLSILGGISLVLIAFLFTSASLGSGAWANMEREPEIQSGIGIMVHEASVDFEPKWSPADTNVDYTVEICVDGGSDPVDEVRLYRHMNDKSTYTDFVCEEKTGWSITSLGDPKESCLYIAHNSSYYIESGECEVFEFSATTPELIPELCNLEWRFETRDIVDQWKQHFVYTSVDDTPPEVTKTILGDYHGDCPPGDEEECWIRQYPNSNISVHVEEKGIVECAVSGLDFCEITYRVDDGPVQEEVYIDLKGAEVWNYEFGFEQDSRHELNITCRDVAGNVMTDIQNYRVDNTPPETEKYFIGPQKEEDGVKWINGVTEIYLNANDPDPTGEGCNIGVDKTWYRKSVYEQQDDFRYCYQPQEYCNMDWLYDGSFEDMTPYQRCDDECINGVQESCADSDQWEQCLIDGMKNTCNIDDWELYFDGPIMKEQESCHVLEYFSVDHLGNIEDVNYNCFFVDMTAPTMNKTVGEPFIEDEETTWVTSETDINFTCVDEGPHPSGEEEFCFKVWYDLADGEEEGGYVTDEYCDKYEGTMDNGACCVSDVQDESIFTFNFDNESNHIVEYFCRDAVNKTTEIESQHYSVDNTPPTIEKTMIGEEGQHWYGDCPPGNEDVCYVSGTTGGIDVEVYDPDPTGMGCNVGDVYCEYEVWLNDSVVGSGSFTEGTQITFDHDSTHTLNISCVDALGNEIKDVQEYIVDHKPSYTWKTYGVPTRHEDTYRWITSETPITLRAEDEKIGVEEIRYRYCLSDCYENSPESFDGNNNEEITCYRDCSCEEEEWIVAEGNKTIFTIPQDSEHCIEYYSVDKFGHEDNIKSQCVYVDNTPPIGEKTVGEPKIPCEMENGVIPQENNDGHCWWVRGNETEITLGCTDREPHPVGHETMCYRIHLESEGTDLTENYCKNFGGEMEDGWCCEYVAEEDYMFTFQEDSNHSLEFYCRDYLGNEEEDADVQWYRVDSTAPETTKNYLGPHYEEEGVQWIDTESRIELVAEDGGEVCAVGGVETYYRYGIVDDSWCWGEGTASEDTGIYADVAMWNHYTEPFHIEEESCHMIEYYSEDALGNEEYVNTQYVFVDKTPPMVTKTYGLPYYVDEDCWTDCEFSNFDTEEETGMETTMSGAIWTTRDDCGDEIQNVNHYAIGEEVWVNGHKFPEGNHSWTIKGLPGKASCHPNEIVASGIVEIGEDGDFCMYAYTVDDEDCGVYQANVGGKKDNYIVIDSAPPWNDTCILDNCSEWITSDTPIWVDAVDEGPHPSGIDTVEYRITMVEDEYCHHEEGWYCENATGEGEWHNYTEPFYVGEESCHLIEIRATDNVNKTTLHKQCVFVDNTPPETVKEVGKPSVRCEGQECEEWDWKITTTTPITLSCHDPEPHPVGNEIVHWRIWWDGDEEWSEWYHSDAGTQILMGEECNHKLEFYCEDALGHVSENNVQRYKVEGSSFNITLNRKWNLISVPFVMLDNSIEHTFSGIEDDIISVWTYDSFEEEWYVYSPHGNENSNTLHTMVPGWGYWVLAEDDAVMQIGGSLFSQVQVPPSKKLSSGWNMIGYFGTENETYYNGPVGKGETAYCALYSLVDTMIGNPRWSALVTYWEEDNPNQWKYLNIEDRMDTGAGYWIEMDVEDSYSFSTICGLMGP